MTLPTLNFGEAPLTLQVAEVGVAEAAEGVVADPAHRGSDSVCALATVKSQAMYSSLRLTPARLSRLKIRSMCGRRRSTAGVPVWMRSR